MQEQDPSRCFVMSGIRGQSCLVPLRISGEDADLVCVNRVPMFLGMDRKLGQSVTPRDEMNMCSGSSRSI